MRILISQLQELSIIRSTIRTDRRLDKRNRRQITKQVQDTRLSTLNDQKNTNRQGASNNEAIADKMRRISQDLRTQSRAIMKIRKQINRNRRKKKILSRATSMPTDRVKRADMTLLIMRRQLTILPRKLITIRADTIIINSQLQRRNHDLTNRDNNLISSMLMLRRIVTYILRNIRTMISLLLTDTNSLIIKALRSRTSLLRINSRVITRVLNIIGQQGQRMTLLSTVLRASIQNTILFNIGTKIPQDFSKISLMRKTLRKILRARLIRSRRLNLEDRKYNINSTNKLRMNLNLTNSLAQITKMQLINRQISSKRNRIGNLILTRQIGRENLGIQSRLRIKLISNLRTLGKKAVRQRTINRDILRRFTDQRNRILLGTSGVNRASKSVLSTFLISGNLSIFLKLRFNRKATPFM